MEELLSQVLDKLTRLQSGQKAIEERLFSMEKAQSLVQIGLDGANLRLAAVYQQAAFLTEFQNETRQAITNLNETSESLIEQQREQAELIGQLAYRSAKLEAELAKSSQAATV